MVSHGFTWFHTIFRHETVAKCVVNKGLAHPKSLN